MKIALRCACGHVEGVVRDVAPTRGVHLLCSCHDCQAFAHFLGRAEDILDAHDGTEIFQVSPSQVSITDGIEHLRCLRLAEGGLVRWYVDCCRMPVGNTTGSSGIPFVGMQVALMRLSDEQIARQEALGPIVARLYEKFSSTPPPEPSPFGATARVIWRSTKLIVRGWLGGKATPSPFFDSETGEPSVEPFVLNDEERNSAYSLVQKN